MPSIKSELLTESSLAAAMENADVILSIVRLSACIQIKMPP